MAAKSHADHHPITGYSLELPDRKLTEEETRRLDRAIASLASSKSFACSLVWDK